MEVVVWWRWWCDGGGGDNWSYKTCKAPVRMPPPTNQHPVFYRPDALPVAQPKCQSTEGNDYIDRKMNKILQSRRLTCVWPSSFMSSQTSVSIVSMSRDVMTRSSPPVVTSPLCHGNNLSIMRFTDIHSSWITPIKPQCHDTLVSLKGEPKIFHWRLRLQGWRPTVEWGFGGGGSNPSPPARGLG